MFKVYYMNQYRKTFSDRDAALNWILTNIEGSKGRYAYGDYEILDKSDFG